MQSLMWRSQTAIIFGFTAVVLYYGTDTLAHIELGCRLQAGVALAILSPMLNAGIATALGAQHQSVWGAAVAPPAVVAVLTITDPTSSTVVATIILLLISTGTGLGGAYIGWKFGELIQSILHREQTG